MKKIALTIMMAVVASAAQAITLFPHFVDVAGDYKDGASPQLTLLNISTDHWREAPSFYKNIKEAEDFLQDTLPFSSYTIDKDTKTLDDGTIIITYTSSLEADGLNKDKWSRLYLVQTPKQPLIVGISEDKL